MKKNFGKKDIRSNDFSLTFAMEVLANSGRDMENKTTRSFPLESLDHLAKEICELLGEVKKRLNLTVDERTDERCLLEQLEALCEWVLRWGVIERRQFCKEMYRIRSQDIERNPELNGGDFLVNTLLQYYDDFVRHKSFGTLRSFQLLYFARGCRD